MIILKSFFRKRTTKIYFIIFCIMFTSIMTIFSFTNYYAKIIDDLFSNNSLMIVSSNIDHYNKIQKTDVVKNIESVVLLKPNKQMNTVKSLPEYIDGVLVGGNEAAQDSLSDISWTVLTLTKLDSVLVLPGSKNGVQLKDNEISIGIREDNYVGFHNDIKKIIGKPIGFYLNEESINFVINSFFPSQWPIFLVSDNVYQQLFEKSKMYSYKVLVNNDMKSRNLLEELKKIDTSEDFKAIVETTYNNEDGNTVARFLDLSDALTFISYIVIVILIIIFIIIIKNIVNDSKKNIMLEKKIGFSNLIIKKNIFLQLTCFGFLSLILSYIISIILNNFINYMFKLNIEIINLFLGVVIYLIMLTIFAVIGLTVKVRINNN